MALVRLWWLIGWRTKNFNNQWLGSNPIFFSGGCIVTVSIKQEEGETICELIQQMPMPAQLSHSGWEDEKEQQHFYIECGKGWTFYMTNLKSILEGGLDLRNKSINLKQVINAWIKVAITKMYKQTESCHAEEQPVPNLIREDISKTMVWFILTNTETPPSSEWQDSELLGRIMEWKIKKP